HQELLDSMRGYGSGQSPFEFTAHLVQAIHTAFKSFGEPAEQRSLCRILEKIEHGDDVIALFSGTNHVIKIGVFVLPPFMYRFRVHPRAEECVVANMLANLALCIE